MSAPSPALTHPPAWRDWARENVDPSTVILAAGM